MDNSSTKEAISFPNRPILAKYLIVFRMVANHLKSIAIGWNYAINLNILASISESNLLTLSFLLIIEPLVSIV
ncbi:MAG: hypothetical protein ACFFEY_19355 [Candidatus Thorarchaeota archaeon]